MVDGSQKYIEFVDAAGGLSKFSGDCSQEESRAVEENTAESNENDENGVEIVIEMNEANDTSNRTLNVKNTTESNKNDENGVECVNEVDKENDTSNRTSNVTTLISACVVCQNGDLPGGAHRCIKCSKNVHPIEGCSNSCGDEEGYGEKRICVACFAASGTTDIEQPNLVVSDGKGKSTSISISKQLNETEKWARKTRSSKSYLAPVKNWNINKKVQDKPKISMLTNGNSMTTIHTVGKRKVKLRNTCGPDSILQVIRKKNKFINSLF